MQTSTFEKEAQLLDKLLDYYPMVSSSGREALHLIVPQSKVLSVN
jgi:hypothetical protein